METAMTTALVVIDVQKIMFADPNWPPHDGHAVVDRIAGLIARARAAGVPVFFVQHMEGEAMRPGAPGFAFVDKLAPGPGDDVTVKQYSSAFHGTDFDARLRKAGVDHLVITGMQSEYCVNSAIRGAYERGYRITLVSDAHSTGDTKVAKARDIIAIQNDTTKGSFGQVVPAAEVSF
jgi:nicotinamidase-related amidase